MADVCPGSILNDVVGCGREDPHEISLGKD